MRRSVRSSEIVNAYCDLTRFDGKRPSLRAIGDRVVLPASGLYHYVSGRAELDQLGELGIWERLGQALGGVPIEDRLDRALAEFPGWLRILSELGPLHHLPSEPIALTRSMSLDTTRAVDWVFGYLGGCWTATGADGSIAGRLNRVDGLICAALEQSAPSRPLTVLFGPGEFSQRLLELDIAPVTAAALEELLIDQRVPSLRDIARRQGVTVSSVNYHAKRPDLINAVAQAVLEVMATALSADGRQPPDPFVRAEAYLTLEYMMATDAPALMELFDEIRIEDCLAGWVATLASTLETCRNQRHPDVTSFDIAMLAHGVIRRMWRSPETLAAQGVAVRTFLATIVNECLTPVE